MIFLSDFTGKELDAETGYSYFGARYYAPTTLAAWLSVDPMADKYPSISPYAYCAWNPMRLVDPNGEEINPVYDITGTFLYNTKEGFTGEPIIASKRNLDLCKEMNGASLVEDLSASQLLDGFGTTFDKAEKAGVLSGMAQEKIYTDIVSKCEGMDVYGFNFSMNDIGNKINYYPKSKTSKGMMGTNIMNSQIMVNHQYDWYETTVENIQSSVVYHEWLGHIKMGWGNGHQEDMASIGGTHYMCYLAVMNSPFWNRTTERYKDFYRRAFDYFFQ